MKSDKFEDALEHCPNPRGRGVAHLSGPAVSYGSHAHPPKVMSRSLVMMRVVIEIRGFHAGPLTRTPELAEWEIQQGPEAVMSTALKAKQSIVGNRQPPPPARLCRGALSRRATWPVGSRSEIPVVVINRRRTAGPTFWVNAANPWATNRRTTACNAGPPNRSLQQICACGLSNGAPGRYPAGVFGG